ncbi:MAG: Flp pilus assembly protein CpaB [Methylocella sp.]
MKIARLAVLGTALVAGIGAAILAGGSKQPAITAAPPPISTDGVLVAAKELNVGDAVEESGLRWVDWPKDQIPEGAIRKSASPAGIEELKGAFAQRIFAPGDLLRREGLDRDPPFARKLASGKRAVAINIDAQGSSTAGGFILPNNKVDVIHIFQDEGAARNGVANSFVSQIILTNIRVLAIGQNVQAKNGERVITGANATLELTPFQAETIVLAQRVGQLSLILRSTSDANAAAELRPAPQQRHDGGPQRRGNTRQGALNTRHRANIDLIAQPIERAR